MNTVTVPHAYRLRRDTAANWTARNPVLGPGEPGVELGASASSPRLKIGNGATPWNDLAYLGELGISTTTDPFPQYLTQAEGDALYVPIGSGGGSSPATTATALESLAAGEYVNLTASGVRLAKAAPGYEAHGFVLAAYAAPETATVHIGGVNTALSGLAVGSPRFLSTAPGATTADVTGYGSGTLIQRLGVPVSATEMPFSPSQPIERA